MLLGNAWKHSDQDGVRVTREGNSFSCSSDSKNRVVNHFVHPPFNTALCAVTVSLSPTPITRPRSRQPRSPRHITPANHHNHNLQQICCSSSIIGYPRPGATCQLSERKEESLSLLRCSVRACQNVTEWLAGYLVRCTVHYCTLHCTLDTVSHCQPSLWYCSTNPSLTNMHPRWNLARSNMYGNSDI